MLNTGERKKGKTDENTPCGNEKKKKVEAGIAGFKYFLQATFKDAQRTHCSSSAYDDVKGKKGSLGEKLYKKNGRVKAKTVMKWQDQGLNYPLELLSKYLYSINCACTTPPTVTFIPEY